MGRDCSEPVPWGLGLNTQGSPRVLKPEPQAFFSAGHSISEAMCPLSRHGGWLCPAGLCRRASRAISHHCCVPKPTSLFSLVLSLSGDKGPTSGSQAPEASGPGPAPRGFPSKRLRIGGGEPRARDPALETPVVTDSNPGPHQTHTGDRLTRCGGAAADVTATRSPGAPGPPGPFSA